MEFWETIDRAYCYNCTFYRTDITKGEQPVGYFGTCRCPDRDKYQTEADDACPFHKYAAWAAKEKEGR